MKVNYSRDIDSINVCLYDLWNIVFLYNDFYIFSFILNIDFKYNNRVS